MRKQNDSHCLVLRNKERRAIEEQIREYLSSGGKIEVLNSAFDDPKDPKCKLGEDNNLFV